MTQVTVELNDDIVVWMREYAELRGLTLDEAIADAIVVLYDGLGGSAERGTTSHITLRSRMYRY